MNKCIKIFENYLNRLGRSPLFWSCEEFLTFLKIDDPFIFKKLSGKTMKPIDENIKEQVSVLYEKRFTVIENYGTSPRLNTLNLNRTISEDCIYVE